MQLVRHTIIHCTAVNISAFSLSRIVFFFDLTECKENSLFGEKKVNVHCIRMESVCDSMADRRSFLSETVTPVTKFIELGFFNAKN
jgi:hypothetical protein